MPQSTSETHRVSLHAESGDDKTARGWRRWLGLFGAPGAWLVQVSFSALLAAQFCYPGRSPLTKPSWDALEITVVAVNLVCIAVAISGTVVTWSAVHIGRAIREADEGVLERGEGRAAFLSVLVAMSSLSFTVGTFFSAQAVLLVSVCGGAG